MHPYNVTMQSGHVYFVCHARDSQHAMQEAVRLADVIHGVVDVAVEAVNAR